ncbi:MAG TPA: hypothetical protein VFQ31_07290 [Methyloceanibacter sp.]|nr:hypothetical protein [Methyloceanibacter sp.]
MNAIHFFVDAGILRLEVPQGLLATALIGAPATFLSTPAVFLLEPLFDAMQVVGDQHRHS